MTTKPPHAFLAPLVPCLPLAFGACSSPREPKAEARPASAPLAHVNKLERVSLADNGSQLFTCTTTHRACKNNSHPTMSHDGVRIVFDSDANGVVPGYANDENSTQIYLRDTLAQRTQLVSAARDANGGIIPPDSGASFGEISGDGEYVAFGSSATNLTPDDPDAKTDVYLARVAPIGLECLTTDINGNATAPSLSANASFVAFVSDAPAVVGLKRLGALPGPIDPEPFEFTNVYVLDRSTGDVEWISHTPDGQEPNASSTQPSIDDIGQHIAFVSEATDLVPIDFNAAELNVFAADRSNGQIQCVSINYRGTAAAKGTSRKPAISGNGRFIVFESTAEDLLRPGEDTNGFQDVFVRDLVLQRIVCVSVSTHGAQANGQSGYGGISGDGRIVVFTSFARNLVEGRAPHGFAQFFARNRDVANTGVFDQPGNVLTVRLSQNIDGVPANARTGGNCDLTADGALAVFMSEANLFVFDDINGIADGSSCSPTCLFGRDVFRSSVP